MTDLEELIGETLRRQANRTPPPGPILARLQRPARRRRGRVGLLLVATTAVVAVSLLVTIQQLTVTSTPAPPGGQPPPEPTVAPKTGPTLSYTAGWLPDGFTEFSRSIGERGMQARHWSADRINADWSDYGNKTTITLVLHTTADPAWSDTEEAIKTGQNLVQIQSRLGNFSRIDERYGSAKLVWMPEPTTILNLNLNNIPNPRQTALKIAESVRADGTSTVRPEIKFGALPAPLREVIFGVIGNSPVDAGSDLSAAKPGGTDGTTPTLSALLSRTAPTQAGTEPVTVRGRQGTYGAPVDRRNTEHNDITAATVAVQLEDGRWLTLSAPSIRSRTGKPEATPLTKDQLVAVLDNLQFEPNPDYAWLGTR